MALVNFAIVMRFSTSSLRSLAPLGIWSVFNILLIAAAWSYFAWLKYPRLQKIEVRWRLILLWVATGLAAFTSFCFAMSKNPKLGLFTGPVFWILFIALQWWIFTSQMKKNPPL